MTETREMHPMDGPAVVICTTKDCPEFDIPKDNPARGPLDSPEWGPMCCGRCLQPVSAGPAKDTT